MDPIQCYSKLSMQWNWRTNYSLPIFHIQDGLFSK
jgi:hypothetical protein